MVATETSCPKQYLVILRVRYTYVPWALVFDDVSSLLWAWALHEKCVRFEMKIFKDNLLVLFLIKILSFFQLEIESYI